MCGARLSDSARRDFIADVCVGVYFMRTKRGVAMPESNYVLIVRFNLERKRV